MPDAPLVSIILPFRDAASYLNEAVQSVIDQEHTNWELLAIDNASSDGGGKLVSQFADPRIQLLSAAEPGVSKARNVGLNAVQGQFVCFLDADDRLPPQSLSLRVAALQQSPNADFCDGTVHFFDQHFQQQERTWRPSFSGKPLDELVKLTGSCFMGISWMCRRTSIGTIRFPEGQTHSEDLSFYLRLAAQGGEYIYVDAPTYEVRVRPNSAMASLEGLEKGYASVASQLPSLGISPELQAVFRKRVARILFRSYLKRLQPKAAFAAKKHWSEGVQ
jgi:glycosyltransferase involved in cell wall biosynthesis